MGMKFGFTEKQIGHMTLKKWTMLYDAYKQNTDNELTLKYLRKRYCDINREYDIYRDGLIDDVIPL